MRGSYARRILNDTMSRFEILRTEEALKRFFDLTMRDGGATFSKAENACIVPERGYAVATGPQNFRTMATRHMLKFVKLSPDAARDRVLRYNSKQFLVMALDLYRDPRVKFIGSWIDDGKMYVEPAVIVPTLDEALSLARAHAQCAIYSFAERVSIPVSEVVA